MNPAPPVTMINGAPGPDPRWVRSMPISSAAIFDNFLTMFVVENPPTIGTISTRPTRRDDIFMTHDCLDRVVPTFDQDIRPQLADQL